MYSWHSAGSEVFLLIPSRVFFTVTVSHVNYVTWTQHLNLFLYRNEDSVFSPTENKENRLTALTPSAEGSEAMPSSAHSLEAAADIVIEEKNSSYVYDQTTDSPSASTSKSPR